MFINHVFLFFVKKYLKKNILLGKSRFFSSNVVDFCFPLKSAQNAQGREKGMNKKKEKRCAPPLFMEKFHNFF